jgi:tetratricopeptide (TPR) repeat protein
MGRRLGLVIGINSYQDAAFRPLRYAETDARALAHWFVNPQGGNWISSDVQLLLGPQATYDKTESQITHLCVNIAGPGDLVFIYFAGHGFLDEVNGEGHLALANTNHRQPTTALHLPSLAHYVIGRSRASQVLVILDCFQNGVSWGMQRSSPFDCKPLLGQPLLSSLQQGGGRMFLCSCRGNELAPEIGERNLGMLSYRMIVGLSGAAKDPETGQVTLQRLHAFLFSALGEQHRPQLFGHSPSPVVLLGDTSSASLPALKFSGTHYIQPAARAQSLEQTAQPSAQMPNTSFRTGVTSSLEERSRASLRSAFQSPASLELATGNQPRPPSSTTQLKQAQQLLYMQNSAQAFKMVEQVLQDEPANIYALILKGQILGTLGRFQEGLSIVEQILHIDTNNALAWSMRAALLTNMGQFLDALPAVERSLELDPRNPETHAIKSTIMANLTPARDGFRNSQRLASVSARKQGGPRSFFIGVGIQLLGLAMGLFGTALPILQPDLPMVVAFLLESLGLALLCVNAARGSYKYGTLRLLLTLFTSAIAAGLLGGLYKFGYNRIIEALRDHPPLLGPILFLALWLALAATVPFLLALGGFIAGIVRRRSKHR